MKKIYIAAWALLITTLLATLFTGNFNAVSLLVFSFSALVLVYALALRTVFANTKSIEPEKLRKI